MKTRERFDLMEITKRALLCDRKKAVMHIIKGVKNKFNLDILFAYLNPDFSEPTDYFIIANGTNTSQIQALADEVEEKLGREGYHLRQMEGYDHANWVLLDFGDIIIHIFDKENRLFYDLERIWRDGKMIEPDSLK